MTVIKLAFILKSQVIADYKLTHFALVRKLKTRPT